MIELRPLPIFSLSQVFARKMGDNKIRHYTLPASHLVVGQITGQTAEDLVRQYIKETEGSDEEVVFLPKQQSTLPVSAESDLTQGPTLSATDVSYLVLKNYPEIKAALSRQAINAQIHQRNVDPTPLRSKFISPITTFLNRGIAKLNGLLRKYQLRNVELEGIDRFEYLDLNSEIFQIPYLPEYGFRRVVSVCSYLSVSFEEDDLKEAVESLLTDLQILHKNKLIMGHLCMPSMMLLADVVGAGKSQYVLFCFLFADMEKLLKICKLKSHLDMPRLPLKLIGVKNETQEGGIGNHIGLHPSEKYEIEEVTVSALPPEALRNAVIDNYNKNVDFVNKTAKKFKKRMEDTSVEKSSENVYSNRDGLSRVTHVKVNTKLTKKE